MQPAESKMLTPTTPIQLNTTGEMLYVNNKAFQKAILFFLFISGMKFVIFLCVSFDLYANQCSACKPETISPAVEQRESWVWMAELPARLGRVGKVKQMPKLSSCLQACTTAQGHQAFGCHTEFKSRPRVCRRNATLSQSNTDTFCYPVSA